MIANALNTCFFYNSNSSFIHMFAIEKYSIHGYNFVRLFPSNESNYLLYINNKYPFHMYLKFTQHEGVLYPYKEDFDAVSYDILECLEKMVKITAKDISAHP